MLNNKHTMIMSNCVIGTAVTRVVTTRVNLFTRVLVILYVRLQISIFGCSFSQSLMNCWNSWKLGASLLHLQLASIETDLNI